METEAAAALTAAKCDKSSGFRSDNGDSVADNADADGVVPVAPAPTPATVGSIPDVP